MSTKGTLLCILLLVYLSHNGFEIFSKSTKNGVEAVWKAPRLNFPWMHTFCNECPPHSCEDDDAIIHGYCCGCAYKLDFLPVICPWYLECPLNLHGLCHDYEYMMRCCC